MINLRCDTCPSPIGEILLVVHQDALCLLDFADNQDRIDKLLQQRFGDHRLRPTPGLLGLCDLLQDYFQGNHQAFKGLRLDLCGSAFQKSVWRALQAIPSGQTISYQQLADNIGNPKAIRAVASANARNPVSIIVPCHRVIGKDGELRGYAGGVERKAWLLKHENAELSTARP